MTIALNKKMTEAGITYNSLHWWLRKYYGSAIKCEHPECLKKSQFFQWALIKGKTLDRKRENFWQLCRKCHFEYDLKIYQKRKFDLGRLKAQKSRIGIKHTIETRNRIKDKLKEKFPDGRIAWNKGKEWSAESKKKMSLAKIGYIPWNKGLKLKK